MLLKIVVITRRIIKVIRNASWRGKARMSAEAKVLYASLIIMIDVEDFAVSKGRLADLSFCDTSV